MPKSFTRAQRFTHKVNQKQEDRFLPRLHKLVQENASFGEAVGLSKELAICYELKGALSPNKKDVAGGFAQTNW